MQREDWLMAAVDEFRPYFLKQNLELPPVKVSCGFPPKGGLSQTRTVLGWCGPSEWTFDGTRQIFISPLLGEGVEVTKVLVHELVHAALPDDVKHGDKFKDAAKKIGLEGPARTATPGPDLMPMVEAITEKLGDYPNPAIHPKEPSREKKAQAKKTFKLFCPDKRGCTKKCLLLDKQIETDYSLTATKKSLALGMPHCPCGSEMEMEQEDFAAYKLLQP